MARRMPRTRVGSQSGRFFEEQLMTFTWTVIVAGVVGWVLGWGSALLTDWLQGDEQLLIAGRSFLVRDPLVQAGSAAVWVAARLVYGDESLRWVFAGLLAVPLIQVGVTDLRSRYVYTVVAGDRRGIRTCLRLAIARRRMVDQPGWRAWRVRRLLCAVPARATAVSRPRRGSHGPR